MYGFTEKTRCWFYESVGSPTEAQTLCWRAVESGKNVFLSSPTGSGKTLAAFLYFLDTLSRRAQEEALPDECGILYISPLKSLGNDISKNLMRPLAGLGLERTVRIAVRNGDTPPREKQAMIRKPPHILITTPESLYLLLSSKSGRGLLKNVKTLILDEFHATASTKRGVHMMLSVARLEALTAQPLQKIALSATVTPLAHAAKILSPDGECEIISPEFRKETDILVDTAVPDMRILPEHSIWPYLADRVTDALESSKSVLAFSDGRASCERLAHKINERADTPIARTHHGCVSKEQRLEAENMLKNGTLRVMAATSSMELGIDVGEIDEVIQIGNPLTVSSLIQRMGRAGHSPGKVSRMRIYPKTAQETLFCALTACAAKNGRIESILPIEMCMDLLCQHLISMASEGVYTVKEAVSILKNAYAYRNLTEETVKEALRLLAGDYEHALDRPVRPRLLYDRIHGTFTGDKYTKMLALSSGGTIPDRGWYKVQLTDGTILGELDEEYVFEARLGDKFMLGAFPWVIVNITRDRVIVEKTSPAGASSPFWKGDSAMRSYETGLYFASLLRHLNECARKGSMHLVRALKDMNLSDTAAETAARVVFEQLEYTSALAADTQIIFEHFRDESNEHQLMVHSPFGGRVNRALGMLLSKEAARLTGTDARAYDDDDGILIYMVGGSEVPTGLINRLDPETAEDTLSKMLPASPMFSIVFRQNAQRAMLMGARGSGRQPLWIQRLRSSKALSDALSQKDHPMVRETIRECFEYYLDIASLKTLLRKIRSGAVSVREIFSDKPSPMCLNLRRQAEAELMYETVIPSGALTLAADDKITIAPVREAVDDASSPVLSPKTPEETHRYLMTTGDLLTGEDNIPLSLLEQLEADGRAVYIDPGLWIAKEHEEQYRKAIADEDTQALLSIVRRAARYRGGITEESVLRRYNTPPALASGIIASLAEAGSLVLFDGVYLHKDIFESAQRKTVSIRRKSAVTAPAAAYADALISRIRKSTDAEHQTACALQSLFGETLPAEMLEESYLPARVHAYREARIDRALAGGAAHYAFSDGKTPHITFFPTDAETDDALDLPETLTDDEKAVFTRLCSRGASFYVSFSGCAGKTGAADALFSLLRKGLVRSDSFAPVRYLLDCPTGSVKTNIRKRVQALDAGRWEVQRKRKTESPEERLNRIFDKYIIACRETSQGENWSELISHLRRMEYAGTVRRGYFVMGLSGAQFIREQDYSSAEYLLNHPSGTSICLSASDPAQPYGKILPHRDGCALTRLSGTAVVLINGEIVCAFEKKGETLRVFDEEQLEKAISVFKDAFHKKEIFPSLKKITVKNFPETAKPALEKALFRPDALFYTLFRS